MFKFGSGTEALTGLERLFLQIFDKNNYNNLVRPVTKETELTNILTELKLLQIDLVIKLN
jgi:hypothetical protein